MSKEYERQLRALRHIAEEGERQGVKISFKEFDEAMDTEWTRR